MDLFRFYKPFVDPRDNEEYRVCRVEDALTGDYAVWLADNMRATVYADGTAIGAEGVRFYGDNPDDGTMTDMKDIYGGYYTWTAAVRDVASAESGTQVQGVCPDCRTRDRIPRDRQENRWRFEPLAALRLHSCSCCRKRWQYLP